jgi:hypothetical protein
MEFDDAMQNGPGRAADWRDAVNAIRDTMTGKGEASRYLADQYGVSRRQAQRWLAGKGAPDVKSGRRDAVRNDPAAARARAAARMRSAKVIAAGKVPVQAKSSQKGAGARNVGVVTVSPAVHRLLSQAADNLESGNKAEAAQLASDAIMRAYGESKGDNGGHAAGNLEIADWSNQIGFIE